MNTLAHKRPVFLFILVAAFCVLLFAGCSKTSKELNTSTGKQVELVPGQSASLSGEPLKVRFVEVVADSRCPTGVQCVWAGQASALVEFEYSGSKSSVVLTTLGSGPGKTDFNNYEIAFNVQPYPEAGKKIEKTAYRLQLTISKKPVTSGGLPGPSMVLQGVSADESCG